MVIAKDIRLDKLTGDFIEALASLGGPPIYKLTPEDARQVLEKIQSVTIDKLPVTVEEKKIPGGPNGDITFKIYRPHTSQNTAQNLGVILYIHGAGWVMGSANTHDRLLRELVVGSNACGIFVEYTRSPEARFPAAIEESYTVLNYIADHGKELNLDSKRIIVAGDSVGGNMAIALTFLAKEREGPKISFQALFYPVTNSELNTSSYLEFHDGPWLTKPAMEWFWNAYQPNVQARKDPLISPLKASIEQLKGLPPALIITAENDVLRDEGEAYAHRLMQAEVSVVSTRFLGTTHDFMMLNPIAKSPATRGAIALANTYIYHVLHS